MKTSLRVFIFITIFALVLSACASQELTPTSPPTADEWSAIKASGVLRVGTAADYPPFSYFNSTGQMDGFDVALIRELGRRLGVTVQINDFAFESLGDALFLDQIDAAIAAITITPDRAQQVDFTNLYFSGREGVLARQDFPVDQLTSSADLIGMRLATQRGTVYEEWVYDNLIDPGLITVDQFFVYDKPENAVRDLRENRVDLVLMDELPAREAATDGLKIVSSGLVQQQFAITVAKGSNLTTELNRVLAEAQNDGTVGNLAEFYLKIDEETADQVTEEPTPPPVQPTVTPVQPTAPPPACVNGLAYVDDLSYDDQNMSNPPVVQPGQQFVKGWRVRNTGTCNWDPSFMLTYVRGNVPAAQMNGIPTPVPTIVTPGNTVDIWVNLVSPLAPGTYQGFWQMRAPNGTFFGQTVWVGITVPGAQPTPAPEKPWIASFIASPTSMNTGECTNLSWTVGGAVDLVELKRDGTKLWDQAPVIANYKDCLDREGAFTYELTAAGVGGSTRSTVVVTVTAYQPPQPEIPTIYEFRAQPTEILIGETVTLFWTTGNTASVDLYRNGELIASMLPPNGSWGDTPPMTGQVTYSVVARNVTTDVQVDLLVSVIPAGPSPRDP